MSGHIIGRPNDDLLELMLGPGADPEQTFIGGCQQGLEEGDGLVVADPLTINGGVAPPDVG